MTALSPTPRTTITRSRERGSDDRAELLDFLATQFLGHLGVVTRSSGPADGVAEGVAEGLAGERSFPTVLPVAFAIDPDGPDAGGTAYVHGSVAAGWLRRAPGTDVCLTVTALDGLVLARSAFHHSMNYRCAVVIGAARLVEGTDERDRALNLVVDQIVPGRSATLRASTRRELAATAVLAIPMAEASFKSRAGDAGDEPEDVEAGVWAGLLPLAVTTTGVVDNGDSHGDVPPDVRSRESDFAVVRRAT